MQGQAAEKGGEADAEVHLKGSQVGGGEGLGLTLKGTGNFLGLPGTSWDFNGTWLQQGIPNFERSKQGHVLLEALATASAIASAVALATATLTALASAVPLDPCPAAIAVICAT